jgi:transposase
MEDVVAEVIIGIDPHKGSHTAVALDRDEHTLAKLRIKATAAQVEQLRAWAKPRPQRTWAVEGARGLGRLLAQQLVAAGENVVDVQPKLAARVRLLNTGQVNKNDPNDARSVAVAALRAPFSSSITLEDETAAMKMWARRYRDLGSLWTQTVCRLHAVFCDLVPGGFARRISVPQAIQLLETIDARTPADTARLELARDLVDDLHRIDAQRRQVKRHLATLVAESRTTLTEIHGVGPVVAATVLGFVSDIDRFASRDHFAAYSGTAPIEVSSGQPASAPSLAPRQPPAQPRRPHGRRDSNPQPRHRGLHLLPPKVRRGHGPQSRAQTQDQRRDLQPSRRGLPCEEEGPGRADGERLCIQRDRLAPHDTGSSEKPLPGHRQAYERPRHLVTNPRHTKVRPAPTNRLTTKRAHSVRPPAWFEPNSLRPDESFWH